jgi:predicted phosphodiesterase
VTALREVAALYDIHGNLPALEAVLADLDADPPDAVVVGGDVCAGPMPVEVLRRLRDLPWPVHWLRGNADRAVVMGFDGTIPPELQDHPLYEGDAWAATFLSREERDFVDSFPALAALTLEGLGEVLFCHATAHSDEERVTIFTPPDRLARILDESCAELLVCGHTHRQFDRRVGARRMVNAGSIGRPYEHEPGAYWLRVGPDFRLIRTPYDVASADAAFHASGYPAAGLIFDVGDADGRARHYERAAEQPVARASLIDPDENPLAQRRVR